MAGMDSLAGWTVAVTAERRADDQADMLRARGATVLMAPMLSSGREDDDELVQCTLELLNDPPDLLVGTTAVGMRAWLATAWSRGLGSPLIEALDAVTIIARGTKAAGAFLSEGLEVTWRAPGETLSEVLEHLLGLGVDGLRIAVQRHGGECSWFSEALEVAGAEVVEVGVYRWLPPASPEPGRRLLDAVAQGSVDAITFTSPPAAAELARLGGTQLLRRLHDQGVVSVCVGPVTAARALEVGLPHVVAASPSRLGPMVRTLTEVLAARAHEVELAGIELRVQGSCLVVGERVERLTPRERSLLEVLIGSRGAVVSKQVLSERAWDDPAGDHTVEVTVNRLRGKLGPAADALETRNRRGYRLAVAS
jgi:uroporphyrinogen-III synthase